MIEASKKANGTIRTKRKIPFWYDKPILIPLIKHMTSILEEFRCDVDPSVLAGLLYDVTLGLEKQGVTNDSSLNLSLFLLNNELFTQSVLEGTYLTHTRILYSRNNTNKTNIDSEQPLNNQTLLNITPVVNITLNITEPTNSSYFLDSRKIQMHTEENKKDNDPTIFKLDDLDHKLHNYRSNTNSNVTTIRIKRTIPTEQEESDTDRALDFLDDFDRRHAKPCHPRKAAKKINKQVRQTEYQQQNQKKCNNHTLLQNVPNNAYPIHLQKIKNKIQYTNHLSAEKNYKASITAESSRLKPLPAETPTIAIKTNQFFSLKSMQKTPLPRINKVFKKQINSDNLHTNSDRKNLTHVIEEINAPASLLLIKWGLYYLDKEKNTQRTATPKKIQRYKKTLKYIGRKNIQDFGNSTQNSTIDYKYKFISRA